MTDLAAMNIRDKTAIAVRLDEMHRFQRKLEPLALLAFFVQAVAFYKLCVTDEGNGVNALIAVVSTFLNVRAVRERMRERRLLDEIGSPFA